MSGAQSSPTIPATKGARQQMIIDLLTRHAVRSQTELGERLAQAGLHVTQATLSRDLVELDAVKVRAAGGVLVYAVPAEGGDRTPRAAPETGASEARLARLCTDFLVSAQATANLVVLRTPPGAAPLLGAAIDKVGISGVVGSIAGDDTVLVIVDDPHGGDAVARRFITLADRHPTIDPQTKEGIT